MPPIDFPDSPALNQTFTLGNRTWTWTGSTWNIVLTQQVQGVQGVQGLQGLQGFGFAQSQGTQGLQGSAGALPATPSDGAFTTSATAFGFMGLPQSASTTGSYTIAASDAGKHIFSSGATGRTVTIDSHANLALQVGTTLTFIAGPSAPITIAVTADTLYLAGTGTTGSRTLAAHGIATAVKTTNTTWVISGNGLT
jgi:hypothetical protein